ncbi:hypothetical protein [Ligilactobacillus agilis]|uniref:hypothetical protein n=1 Tax=Ligilactobacillus agilis TaxID=1601 RepID=UPI001866DE4D|nr:hypothetical protein [Ligilactobacillus agilis]
MHSILGYTWSELASILGVVSVVVGFVYWLFSYSGKVFNRNIHRGLEPFLKQLTDLNETIKRMNENFKRQESDLEELEHRVDEHDRRLDRHHERIRNFLNEKERDNDK